MNPDQLIQRIEKIMRDAARDKPEVFVQDPSLVLARSLAAEAARTPLGIRRDRLMAEAQDMLKDGQP